MINLFENIEEFCPICGNPVVYENGLIVCYYCGWSEEDKDECTE